MDEHNGYIPSIGRWYLMFASITFETWWKKQPKPFHERLKRKQTRRMKRV
jgi:hypothetical protein